MPVMVGRNRSHSELDGAPSQGCGTSLQAMVDAAAAGSTLDVSGCNYTAGATISKALTVKGCDIQLVGTAKRGLIVAANSVTIDTVGITGTGASSYNDSERGIQADGAYTGLVVKNTTIDSVQGYGIWMHNVVNPTIGLAGNVNTITNCGYTGIAGLSLVGGTIAYNTVAHVGEFTSVGGPPPGENNAYGIFVSAFDGDSLSADVTIDHNDVSYVPNWEAIDTHGGLRLNFTTNHISFSRRAFVFTTTSDGRKCTDIVATGNTMDNPYSPGTAAHPTYAGDYKTFLLDAVHNSTIQNNTSVGYPADKREIYDLGGLSDGTKVWTPNSFG